MNPTTLLILLFGSLVAGVPVYAHHSFAAYYFEDQRVSIEGEIVQFLYQNPHTLVYVMAKDENGRMQRFAVEWGGVNRLGQWGVTKDTLKPGDYVLITGSPGRDPAEHKLHMKTIERPADGWRWRVAAAEK